MPLRLHTNSYSYKPTLHFFKLDDEDLSTTPTYGFELEIQYGQSNEGAVCEFLANIFETDWYQKNIIYLKHDGSVRDGIEIVSQPMTFKFFQKHLDKFEYMINGLNKMGCTSHKGEKCGLHFHVGNNYFENINLEHLQNLRYSDSQKKDMQLLFVSTNMNRIINHFKNNLTIFSRRTKSQVNQWCSFDDCNNTVKNNEEIVKQNLKKGSRGRRYKALNTTNTNTLEFRLLRGTLNFKTFCLSFNLVNNLTIVSLLDNRCVSWDFLLNNGLNASMLDYANDYMEYQMEQPKYQDLRLKTSCIYTQKNELVAKEKCDSALKRLGIL